VLCRVDTGNPWHVSGGSNLDVRDESVRMNATKKGNVQSAWDSAIIGEHALSR
jgi:hypothetical protein